MKLYNVIFSDGRQTQVAADTWMEVDDKYVFYRGGSPIPDVSLSASAVDGITVAAEEIGVPLPPLNMGPQEMDQL